MAPSIVAAMELVQDDSVAFVVGGAEIYRLTMPLINNLYLTRILADIAGDAFFSHWNESDFECIEHEFSPADAFNEWPSEYLHLVRKKI